MEIVNLTPYRIILPDGRAFPPSGKVARVDIGYTEITEESGLPVVSRKARQRGKVIDLPVMKSGTVYIVSMLVMNEFPNRWDLVCPYSDYPNTHSGTDRYVKCFIRNY